MNIEAEFHKRIKFLSRRQQGQVMEQFREVLAQVGGIELPKKKKGQSFTINPSFDYCGNPAALPSLIQTQTQSLDLDYIARLNAQSPDEKER